MPVSGYFQTTYASTGEQRLIEDLVTESIKIYGVDVYYLPRTEVARDELLTEDPQPSYLSAHLIEMYIENMDRWGGVGDILSRVGGMNQIRDRVTLVVSRRSFAQYVGQETTLTRPREGDIVWVPLNNKLFRVLFVEHEVPFYQLGGLQSYQLECELMELSNELFLTGVPALDRLTERLDTDLLDRGLLTEDGTGYLADERTGLPILLEGADTFALDDLGEQNDDFEREADLVIDWSEDDPFSEGLRY